MAKVAVVDAVGEEVEDAAVDAAVDVAGAVVKIAHRVSLRLHPCNLSSH